MHIFFLSIDIGTSALKAVLFSRENELLFFRRVEFERPQSEHPFEWVAMLAQIATEIPDYISDASSACLYITISGHGPSLVYLNTHDEVIHYTAWNDDEGSDADKKHDTQKGSRSFFLPLVHHVRKTNPGLFTRISHVLAPAEYVAYKLCGKQSFCIPHEQYVPYIWSAHDMHLYNLSEALFPPAVYGGTVLGDACTRYAAETFAGGYKNVRVVAGGLDYLSALIGAYLPDESCSVFQRSGTSVVLNAAVGSHDSEAVAAGAMPRISEAAAVSRNFAVPHFFPNRVNIGYTVPYYNELYAWIVNHTHNTPAANDLIQASAAVDTRFVERTLMPCFSYHDSIERLNAALIDKNITSAKEKTAYGMSLLVRFVARTYRVICEAADIDCARTSLTVSGGHAGDETLMRLYAYVLNKRVRVFTPRYCELRGNVILARVAAGLHESVTEAMKHMSDTQPPRVFNP